MVNLLTVTPKRLGFLDAEAVRFKKDLLVIRQVKEGIIDERVV